LGEAYWNVRTEEVREQRKKVSQRIEGLAQLIRVQRVSLSMNHYVNRYWLVLSRGGLIGVQKPTFEPSPTTPETFHRLLAEFWIRSVGHYT